MRKAMKLAIIDDEIPFRKSLAASIKAWGRKEGLILDINEYPSAEAFLFDYEDKKYFELLLLDIEMAELNGIELAKKLRGQNDGVQIVFITGYPDFIGQGYDVEALHYLIKPVSSEKLFDVLERALKKSRGAERKLIFRTDEGMKAVYAGSILYAESCLHNIRIVTKDCEFETRMALSALVEMLGDQFISIHRSYLVNIPHIISLTRHEITLDSGEKLPVARNRQAQVHNAFVAYHRGEE